MHSEMANNDGNSMQSKIQQLSSPSKQENTANSANKDVHQHPRQQQTQVVVVVQEQDQQNVGFSNEGKKTREEGLKHNEKRGEQVTMGPRERLKKHRREVAGKVWIPEMWGQEDFLKDWIDCTSFDASLVPQNIMLARSSLMDEARRASSASLHLENSC